MCVPGTGFSSSGQKSNARAGSPPSWCRQTQSRNASSASVPGERGVCRVARAIVEVEARAAGGREVPHHRHDRRDADAAGDEQEAPGARMQREFVARRGHRQARARREPVDHAARAAAAGVVALHGNLVPIRFAGIIGERVAAHHAGWGPHGEMCAGREWRQRAAGGIAQLVTHDVDGRGRDLRHQQLVEDEIVGLGHGRACRRDSLQGRQNWLTSS